MFTKHLNKKQKNLNGKEVKKMKRLIALSLIVGLAFCTLALPCAQADDPSPWRKVITWIDYVWNGAAKLLSQVMYSTATGYTDLGGDAYEYTINSKVTFDVINGVAYDKTSHSEETRTTGDGKETIITTDITYERDATGRLLDATGTRTIKGWTAEVDENDDGTIDEGEGRKYYEETSALEFEIINGAAEVVKETTTRKTYDTETKANLISETTSTTTRTYQIINGVTKLVDVETTGKTTFYNDGTYDDTNYPYTEFTTKTHYAYDAKGNILPMSGVEKKPYDVDEDGTIEEGEYALFDSDGNLITDTNDDGSVVDEALALMSGSYTVTYSSGIGKGAAGEWVVFVQTELTPFKVENGMAIPLWTYTEYSNNNLIPDAAVDVLPDPIVQGTVVAIHKVESEANNVGTKNTATWVIIRDAQGRLWAYRYFNGLSDIGSISVGDKVEAQGNTMAGEANMVEATVALKKL